MNIYEAIKEMEKGKKIRRPIWKEDSYWKIGADELIEWNDSTPAKVHLNQIKAKDFEIFEDNKIYLQCGYEDECHKKDCLNCPKKNTYCFELTQSEECVIEDFGIGDLNDLLEYDGYKLELMQKIMKKLMIKIFKIINGDRDDS